MRLFRRKKQQEAKPLPEKPKETIVQRDTTPEAPPSYPTNYCVYKNIL